MLGQLYYSSSGWSPCLLTGCLDIFNAFIQYLKISSACLSTRTEQPNLCQIRVSYILSFFQVSDLPPLWFAVVGWGSSRVGILKWEIFFIVIYTLVSGDLKKLGILLQITQYWMICYKYLVLVKKCRQFLAIPQHSEIRNLKSQRRDLGNADIEKPYIPN